MRLTNRGVFPLFFDYKIKLNVASEYCKKSSIMDEKDMSSSKAINTIPKNKEFVKWIKQRV